MFRIPLDNDRHLQLGAEDFEVLGWFPLLLVSLLIVAAGWIVWVQRHERRLLAGARGWSFLALRLGVLGLIAALLFWEPRLTTTSPRSARSRVIVAVDASESMKITDGAEGSRYEHGLRLADALVEQLQGTHEVQRILFHERLWPLGEPDAGGSATDLSLPLTLLAQKQPSDGNHALVLFTDGQPSAGPALKTGERRRWPIFPVAVGNKIPPADVAVVSVVPGKRQLPKGGQTEVVVAVRMQNVPAQDFLVELHAPESQKFPLQTKIVQHDGKDGVLALPAFPMEFADVGNHRIEAKIKPRHGQLAEITQANNQGFSTVRVGQDKFRVLLIDEDARWEYQFLASALGRDEEVELKRVLFVQPRLGLAPVDKLESAGFAAEKLAKQEPGQEDPLNEHDTIILGDVDPEHLPAEDRVRLAKFVTERGGTLVVVAGKRWSQALWADAALAPLLPIEKSRVHAPLTGFRLDLSAAGQGLPFFKIQEKREAFREASEAEPREFWRKRPKHFWSLVGTPRPGATVLFKPEDVDEALAALQNVGFGRVIFMGLDSTYRWRLEIGDSYHHQFWGQLVRWAGSDPWHAGSDRLARFGVLDPLIDPGKKITLTLRLRPDAPKLDPTTAHVAIYRQDAVGAKTRLGPYRWQPDPQRPLGWRVEIEPLPAGTYQAVLEVPELEGKLPPESAKSRRDLFTVLASENREMQNLAVNETLLRTLAHESGGQFCWAQDAGALPAWLDAQREAAPETRSAAFWQEPTLAWQILGVLAGWLCGEWLLRKLNGLP